MINLFFEKEHEVSSSDLDFWESAIMSLKPKNVLDIGFETGRIARKIINNVDFYCGIDL
jgi:hypothetical protein